MSTNLPKSRNRNLPSPPAESAEVRRRPVMTPVQQAPEDPESGQGILRRVLAMLIIGGLLAAGIFFYMRGADSDLKKRESATAILTGIGRQIWQMKGAALSLSAESEERKKDLDDLPRIFMKAAEHGKPNNIRVIEGDPPPGKDVASHQIHYIFGDEVKLVLCVLYAPEDGKIIFLGVHNRFDIPERKPTDTPRPTSWPANSPPPPPSNTPQLTPDATPAPVPPPTPAPSPAPVPAPSADTPPAPPAEKVSEPPANPR